MTTTEYQKNNQINYSPQMLARAKRSLICSPFAFSLFALMSNQRVAMNEIAGDEGVKNGYTSNTLSELFVDNALVWLIQVGMVRREVDGQGITDSFRLTPLGKQLVLSLTGKPLPTPTWRDRIADFLTRWLHIPF